MNHSPSHDDEPLDLPAAPADMAAARLLDEQLSAEELPALSPVERRRVADLQWLHSLLQQAFHREAVARDRRIARACLAIREDAARQVQPAAAPARRRSLWVLPSLVAAALVLLAVFLRGPFDEPPSAIAAVQLALKETSASPDRLYRLDVHWKPVVGGEPQDLVGDLWVRGSTHYLLKQQSPLGELYLGGNGREHWLAPPVGPVLVGGQRFEELLLGGHLTTPFLQVSTLLERLADRYDLSLADEEDVPAVEGQGTVRCTRVVGRRRDAQDVLAPDVIELWTARQSGIAYRLRAEWSAMNTGPQRLQLQLVSLQAPQPDDWYVHASHHAPSRRVIRHPSAGAGL